VQGEPLHALVDFHVVGLFSFRALTSNAFAARTLVCPTPAGVKMAMLAALLRRDGAEAGQTHVDWLAPLGVAWRPPPTIATSQVTVRVYKADAVGKPLTMQVGMREYAHMEHPFGLAILDVPDQRRADVEHALGHLRALGTTDSLVQPLAPPVWCDAVPAGFALLTGEHNRPDELPCVVDDFGPRARFERLSAYRAVGRDATPVLGEDRRRLLLTLPLRVRRRRLDGVVLEALPV
jgi:hypothetical protein